MNPPNSNMLMLVKAFLLRREVLSNLAHIVGRG